MVNQKHQDKMYVHQSPKETLDVLVHKICETTQLMETTVRDLFSNGYEWHNDKFVKHRTVYVEDF